jgi:hypothetical protein
VPSHLSEINKQALQAGFEVGEICLRQPHPNLEWENIPEFAAWVD